MRTPEIIGIIKVFVLALVITSATAGAGAMFKPPDTEGNPVTIASALTQPAAE